MQCVRPQNRSLAVAVWLTLTVAVGSAGVEIIPSSVSPLRNEGNVDLTAPIVVNFDRPINTATVTSLDFWAFGRFSGTAVGTISFTNGNQSMVLTPNRRFQAGETVTVFLSRNIQAVDGNNLRTAGYSWQFTTRTRCSPGLSFTQIDEFSNRDEFNGQTRIYGAVTTDFTNDGWVDIATINEVSADMRLFVNRADGTGLYEENYVEPVVSLRDEVSPNEPGDFNRDGNADFAVASSATNTLCIVLGNGDGTFSPAQFLAVGAQPHGVAVLDFDGDGDADIATANTNGNNITLLRNNGSGVFANIGNIESGGNGEYGLIAGDMNHDGLLDLIVGARSGQRAIVMRANGNASFTTITNVSIGGEVWVIVAGDLNGDRNLDIAAGNAFSNNGTILFGTATGGLSAPTAYPSPGHTPSADIGDLDGDGDLDWVLSSFGGGSWRVYRNNGLGVFTFVTDIAAPDNPSCAALFDTDNDGDVDLTLYDEIADVVKLLRNNSNRWAGDVDLDGDVDLTDLSRLLANFGVGSGAELNDGDIDFDGDVDLTDLSQLLSTFGQGCP